MSYSTARRIGALTGCLGASLAFAAPAHGAAVLTTGQLTGPDGAAVSGTVRVYAWPHATKAMELPLLGSATAAADGRFSVAASDDRALLRLARQRGGWLDFTAVADAAGRQGEWTFTGHVNDDAGVVRVVTPEDAAPAARVARVAGFAPPPAIGLKAARTVPTIARAAQTGRCENKREMTRAQVTHSLAVVGELNNAYNDGTWGRFTYGRGGSAETSIGVAASYGPVSGRSAAPRRSATKGRRRSRRFAGATPAACSRSSSSTSSRRATTPAPSGTPTSRRPRGTAEMPTGGNAARSTSAIRTWWRDGPPAPSSVAARTPPRAGRAGAEAWGDQSDHAIRVLGDGGHRVRLQGAPTQGALHLRPGRPRVALHCRAHLLRRAQVEPVDHRPASGVEPSPRRRGGRDRGAAARRSRRLPARAG